MRQVSTKCLHRLNTHNTVLYTGCKKVIVGAVWPVHGHVFERIQCRGFKKWTMFGIKSVCVSIRGSVSITV